MVSSCLTICNLMKKSVLLVLFFAIGAATFLQAQPFYLRGEAAPCGWSNSDPACELTDPDMDGIYELTYDFGGTPIGRKLFKIHDAGTGNWYPGGDNMWFNHQGGTVTFRFNTANSEVDASESIPPTLCAPGEFSAWNNAESMTDMGGGQWCYTVPAAGTYQWKPTYCGSWDSWQPSDGERAINSGSWQITTTAANEQICVQYDMTTGRVTSTAPPPTGYYLRGTAGPCGWVDLGGGCKLEDPEMDGIYELQYDFGGTPIGRQEFKIYHVDTDTWWPAGNNGWYDHQGGVITFRINSATGEVEATEGTPLSICAPGAFSGWDNAAAMQDMGNGLWCYTIPTAGTYDWKPTFCGRWDSWNAATGERDVNAGNWSVTTIVDNQQMCLTYDMATGQVSAAAVTAVPTMGQWGMIIFTLLMVAMGLVVLRQQKLVTAGSQNVSFSLRNLPFEKSSFSKALLGTGIATVAIFAIAMVFFGYEMTNADVPGSLLAIPIVAYVVMMLRDERKN